MTTTPHSLAPIRIFACRDGDDARTMSTDDAAKPWRDRARFDGFMPAEGSALRGTALVDQRLARRGARLPASDQTREEETR